MVKYRYFDCDEVDLNVIDVHVDSDWAGERYSRKSNSGGLIAWAGGLLKSWSKRQSTIATSSGEAELYAMAKGVL